MNNVLKILFPVLALLCMVFIFSNSMQPSKTAEKKQSTAVEIVEKVAEKVTKKEVNLPKKAGATFSKTVHVIEFSLFSVFLSLSLLLPKGVKEGIYEKVLLCGIFIAVTDEHLQLLYEGRGSKLTDVLVDLAGVIIGYFIAVLIVKIVRRKKNGTISSNP